MAPSHFEHSPSYAALNHGPLVSSMTSTVRTTSDTVSQHPSGHGSTTVSFSVTITGSMAGAWSDSSALSIATYGVSSSCAAMCLFAASLAARCHWSLIWISSTMWGRDRPTSSGAVPPLLSAVVLPEVRLGVHDRGLPGRLIVSGHEPRLVGVDVRVQVDHPDDRVPGGADVGHQSTTLIRPRPPSLSSFRRVIRYSLTSRWT